MTAARKANHGNAWSDFTAAEREQAKAVSVANRAEWAQQVEVEKARADAVDKARKATVDALEKAREAKATVERDAIAGVEAVVHSEPAETESGHDTAEPPTKRPKPSS